MLQRAAMAAGETEHSVYLSLAFLAPAPAQRVAVTPFVALYTPLDDRIVRTDTVGPPTQVVVTERPGAALGALFTLMTPGPLDYEASIAIVRADLRSTAGPPSNTVTTGPGTLLVGSLRGVIGLGPNDRIIGLHLLAGGSVVMHLGSWDDNWKGTTDLGGVLGAATTFGLGSLRLRVAVEDYIFSASFKGSATTGTTKPITQQDLQLSVGLSL